MLSTPNLPPPAVSSAEEPKKLYRLIEPAFEDLPADHAADFFRAAHERVRAGRQEDLKRFRFSLARSIGRTLARRRHARRAQSPLRT